MGVCFGDTGDLPKMESNFGEQDTRRTSISRQRPEMMTFDGGTYKFACVSRAGCNKSGSRKVNQDSYCAIPNFCKNPEWAFFAVYDGHGTYGHLCSAFCRDNMPMVLAKYLDGSKYENDPEAALKTAFVKTDAMLHANKTINDKNSGTTCIAMLVRGTQIYVANAGDSRAIMVAGSCSPGDSHTSEDQPTTCLESPIIALSTDQDTYREDEAARVVEAGGKVMTSGNFLTRVRSNTPGSAAHELHASSDTLRVWGRVDSGGLAVTRSLGDFELKDFGVIPNPEILSKDICGDDARIFLGSDGIFDVWFDRDVVDDMKQTTCPMESCMKIVRNAKQEWVVTGSEGSGKIDDMTAMSIFFTTSPVKVQTNDGCG